MEEQPSPREGTGKDPSTVESGNCGKIWARTGQKILEKENIIHSEVQSWNFRNIQYQEAEGPRGLCSRLHNFCMRWLRPEKHTKAQMLDLVVLELLLSLLPPEMEGWVRECGVETSSEAVALAEGFLLSQAEEEKEQVKSQSFTVGITDPETRRNPSKRARGLTVSGSSRSPRSATGKNRRKLTPTCDGAEAVVESETKEAGLVLFEEVTVCFSEEEWSQLDPHQKALHWEVMLENHRNVASLGNNGEENDPSEDLFQTMSCRYSRKNPEVQMEVESHERNQSNNWNWESSSSIQAPTKHSVAGQQKIKKKYTGKRIKLCQDKLDVKEHYQTQTKGEDDRKNELKTRRAFSLPHRYVSYTSLQTIHRGENPWMDCEKTFTQSSQIISRERIHNGEKTYQCLQCGKNFTKDSQLTRHKRIHTGEKPYKYTEREMDTGTANPGPKRKRRSYEASFKLKVVSRAEESNNRTAGKEFCVDEKQVREWRKMKAQLEKIPKAKRAQRGLTASYGALETELHKWVMECRQNGCCVTRRGIRLRALQMAKDDKYKAPGTENFVASAGWCTRFMNRFGLCL